MNRRQSITLHDIVRMNPVAKEHYFQIRSGTAKGKELSSILDQCEQTNPHTASFSLPEKDNIIKYDPLLLAESLIILEEEQEEDTTAGEVDNKDGSPSLPQAIPISARRVSIGGEGTKTVSISESSLRKKSAIDQHERIVAELQKMGFMVL